MLGQSRFFSLTIILLLVLFVSLARPMAVYADDSTPPPPTEEPADPTTEEAPTEEAPVEVDSSSPSEAPMDVPGESAATEMPAEPTVESEPAAVSEILEAAPEGTEVVVLDEHSEVVPLASEEAAEIVAAADPVWCPTGQNPGNDMSDGVQHCSNTFANSQLLIDDMDNSNPNTTNSMYETDGTIYFTANPGGAFLLLRGSEIQSLDYDALKIYNLTLQGGWNGSSGLDFALDVETDFGANRIQIGTQSNPWAGNITINNLSINGVSNTGLIVFTQGDINLNDVHSDNNTLSGARLVNTSGTGSVTIQNSSFDGNTDTGLRVASNGDITLNGVLTQENAKRGAELNNTTGSGNINVSSSGFNNNSSRGLEIASNGDVTLTDVSASNNLAVSGSFISAGSLVIENSVFNNNASSNPASGQGLIAEADEAEIICSQFSGNSTYGLDGTLVSLLTLNDVVFGGNGSGDYLGSPFVTTGGCSTDEGGEEGEGEEGGNEGEEGEGGGEGEEGGGGGGSQGQVEGGEEGSSSEIIPLTGLALHIVSVTGSDKVDLDCEAFSGTKLVLPNGDSVILPCPIRDEGSLVAQAQDGLPGQLDGQFGFLSAMNTEVLRDGQAVSTVEPSLIVEFVIPDGQDAENLAILHWDGAKWVEFPGHVTGDGYFAVATNFTGVFVLVTK